MKLRITVVLAALAASPVAAAAADPQYDVCRTQLVDYVETHFGSRVTRIDFRFDYDDRPFFKRGFLPLSGNQALVYTDGCDGYHVFDLTGSHFDCMHRAHYGAPRHYVRYRSSGGGCRQGSGGD